MAKHRCPPERDKENKKAPEASQGRKVRMNSNNGHHSRNCDKAHKAQGVPTVQPNSNPGHWTPDIDSRSSFLPVNRRDMEARGWTELDFLLITGDAYVDHPSFGVAIISRLLEKHGFKVGVLAQPDWKETESFRALGRPRLACLISGGNLDSMVNHYTAAKKRRSQDAYSPGGKTGLRPDHATIVYANRVREALPGIPVVIGGIEASLRRFAHYDYWSNKIRRSILLDSQADILVFGMGERAILEIAGRLAGGTKIEEIKDIRGTMVPLSGSVQPEAISLPSFEEISLAKRRYAESFAEQYKQQDPIRGQAMYERYERDNKGVFQNAPALPLDQAELDEVYALPFARAYHPDYEAAGGVPALKEVEFSLVSARGCFGACSFCALTFHQGRIIQGRSADSLVREAEILAKNRNFKGYIHDVGGPTANFRRPACRGQLKRGACAHRQCLFPQPCDQLDVDHTEYIELLRRIRGLPGVKKVFVRSGIRYDAVLADRKTDFLRELCLHHVSGQLKVAPEHISDQVLKYMGKPGKAEYNRFVKRFAGINQELGKKQYLVPYLMSSHPGSGLKEAIELAEYVRDMGVNPEQVQDFIPTPGTLSTCMYYTGLDPRTLEAVYVPRSSKEKALQRALIQYRNPKNFDLVAEALRLAHREDLIGYGPKCLLRPQTGEGNIKLAPAAFGRNKSSKVMDKKGAPSRKTGKFERADKFKGTDKLQRAGRMEKAGKQEKAVKSENAGSRKNRRNSG